MGCITYLREKLNNSTLGEKVNETELGRAVEEIGSFIRPSDFLRVPFYIASAPSLAVGFIGFFIAEYASEEYEGTAEKTPFIYEILGFASLPPLLAGAAVAGAGYYVGKPIAMVEDHAWGHRKETDWNF